MSPGEVLRLKEATVYVRTRHGVGSGFFFRREVTEPVLIATNHHVIAGRAGPAQRIDVVLHSGTPRQEVRRAELVALSPDDDLAVLRLEGNTGERSFLDLSREQVFETQPIRVVGFPFGELLERRASFPSPTLATGTISSLRYDNRGVLERVQLDADVNPGNSGGPIVDSEGRVVGVAVETVLATNISFMIPVGTLRRVLDGFVSGYDHELDGMIVRVRLRVEDPLKAVTEVGLNADLAEREPDEYSRSWPVPVVGKQIVAQVPKGRDLDFQVSLSKYRNRVVWIQPWFRRGEELHGLSPFRVDLRAGVGVAEKFDARADGERGAVPSRALGWLGGGSKGSALLQERPVATRADLGGLEQNFRDVQFRDVLEVGSHVVDLTFSPNGKHVYLLEEGGTLRKVLADSLREERKLVFEAVASSVAWSDEGLVVGLPALREVVVVSARTLKPLEAIRVPDATSVASASGLDVAFTLPPRGKSIYLVDLEHAEVVGEFDLADLKEGSACDRSWREANDRLPKEIGAIAAPEGGEYLLMVCGGSLFRFKIEGERLVCEELGPNLGTNTEGRGLSVSPDGLYVSLQTHGGNPNLASGRNTSGTVHIFSVKNLGEPVLTVHTESLDRLGYDVRRRRIYARGRDDALRIFNSGGAKIDEYSLLSRHEYLKAVYGSRRGDVLFLRTTERLLWMRFQ